MSQTWFSLILTALTFGTLTGMNFNFAQRLVNIAQYRLIYAGQAIIALFVGFTLMQIFNPGQVGAGASFITILAILFTFNLLITSLRLGVPPYRGIAVACVTIGFFTVLCLISHCSADNWGELWCSFFNWLKLCNR